MKKRNGIAAALAALLLLSGCGASKPAGEPMPSTQENPASPERKTEIAIVKWGEAEFGQAVVSRSQRFGSVYPAPLGEFPAGESLQAFVEAFRDAEKMEGVLDIGKPEYDVSFVGEDGEAGFHLWLGYQPGSRGLYTYVEDTGTGYTLTEEHTDRLRELIRSLDYTPDQASANGDIVNLHGELTNLDKWTNFVEQVQAENPSEAHMTSYTIEGDPIFEDFIFDGQAIQYTYDNTMDAFGVPKRSIDYCKNLEQDGGRYTLSKCGSEQPRIVLEVL
ncbi:DUF4362 domain-containing protein [Cohnella hongkongensis]|uniref:DUF4362 domain-containing protein n=1 Tax=Cohnella hongkongensis TaxID=178337 RepID=A0ABV9FE34_9BACL